jgi:hypothetical protein
MLSDATMAYAEEITTALLGLDAYYRIENPDDDAGLVVLNMSSDHRGDEFSSYGEAASRFTELRERASGLPEADRRLYYRQVCDSKLAFIRWRRGELPFERQVYDFLHVPAAPASGAELDELRGGMRDLLNRMGYGGDLASQSTAWEMRVTVPPAEVAGTLTQLLDEAWDRTTERMEIPAERSDGMRVVAVSGVPFNARCNYPERTIDLNIDPVLTLPGLKHLAVHEGYPGHYVQFKLREVGYRDGVAPADGLLSVVNTASSCTFEGIADNGMRVIDWISTDDDQIMALMNRYRAGIVTVAAWRLHALGHPVQTVTNWLRSQTLIGGEGWVANRMAFIAAQERCALIWSYWHGESSIAPIWQNISEERRSDFLEFLYGRLHSPQTVAMFPSPTS